MIRIPKCSSKYFIHQIKNINPSQKESTKENIAQKISKKTLKFTSSRHFGKDLTNNIKSNIPNIYNNHCTKVVTILDKKQNSNNNTNIYIKKHSSASQVSQKNHKIKISYGERKLRGNKSNLIINKKSNNNNISSESCYNNNKQPNTKLHSSISFGINANNRPISSNNYNNYKNISVRLSNPKNNNNANKFYTKLNNRSINNIYNNTLNHNYKYNYSNNINKITKNENMNHTQSTLDLM